MRIKNFFSWQGYYSQGQDVLVKAEGLYIIFEFHQRMP